MKYHPNPQVPEQYPIHREDCLRCLRGYVSAQDGWRSTYTKPVWICHTFNRFGRQACASRQIPENILERLSADVLGLDAFDADTFEHQIASTCASLGRIGSPLFLRMDGRLSSLGRTTPVSGAMNKRNRHDGGLTRSGKGGTRMSEALQPIVREIPASIGRRALTNARKAQTKRVALMRVYPPRARNSRAATMHRSGTICSSSRTGRIGRLLIRVQRRGHYPAPVPASGTVSTA